MDFLDTPVTLSEVKQIQFEATDPESKEIWDTFKDYVVSYAKSKKHN